MKKILFTLITLAALSCNNGGGGGEPCCTGSEDANCDGKCDKCGGSMEAASFDQPCGAIVKDSTVTLANN